MYVAYEKGELVKHRALYQDLAYGIGIVTYYDKWMGLYKVFGQVEGFLIIMFERHSLDLIVTNLLSAARRQNFYAFEVFLA